MWPNTQETAVWSHLLKKTLMENFIFSAVKLVDGIGEIFHDGGPHHLEPSQMICRENQWSGSIW